MPWTHKHRWLTFLISVVTVLICCATSIVILHDFVSHPTLSPQETSILTGCSVIVSILGIGIRNEVVTRNVKHDLLDNQSGLHTAATLTDRKLDTVIKQTNGGMVKQVSDEIKAAVDVIPVSQAMEMVRQAQEDGCAKMVGAAADAAVAKYIEATRGNQVQA